MEHRAAIGLFLALAVNRPVAALNARLPICRGARRLSTTSHATSTAGLVDVDANLLHPDLSGDIDHHIQVLTTMKLCRCIGFYFDANISEPVGAP